MLGAADGSLSTRTPGSLLAAYRPWQLLPSLLCSGPHRFNKEKYVSMEEQRLARPRRPWQQEVHVLTHLSLRQTAEPERCFTGIIRLHVQK